MSTSDIVMQVTDRYVSWVVLHMASCHWYRCFICATDKGAIHSTSRQGVFSVDFTLPIDISVIRIDSINNSPTDARHNYLTLHHSTPAHHSYQGLYMVHSPIHHWNRDSPAFASIQRQGYQMSYNFFFQLGAFSACSWGITAWRWSHGASPSWMESIVSYIWLAEAKGPTSP